MEENRAKKRLSPRGRIAGVLVLSGLVVFGVAWGITSVAKAPRSVEPNPDIAAVPDAQKAGFTVRIRFEAEPGSLNPWLHHSIYTQFIADYVFDSLLEQDLESYEWKGQLAEEWEEEIVHASAEGQKLRYTFRLNRNRRFHDGNPVTADDVVFSLNAVRNPSLKSQLGSYFADVESCRAVDAHTVEVVYRTPYWMAKKHLGELPILPRHVYDPEDLLSGDAEKFAAALKERSSQLLPVGSGPYRAERWDRGNQVVLDRVHQGSEPVAGSPRRIVFRFIKDHVAAVQALKNGEIDFIPRLDAELFDAEQGNAQFASRFRSSVYYTEYFDFVAWNLERPFFSDKRVRQALAYGALDRNQFLETVLNGRGKVVSGSQYYFGPAYNHDVAPHPFDTEKAKALLAQAGWIDRNGDGTRDKDGVEFRFELSLRSGNTLAKQRAAVMQQSLAGLQIRMEIRELELGAFVESVTQRRFDACSLGWVVEAESDPYQLWHSSQIGEAGSNLPGLRLPSVDALIERSRAALDDGTRRQLFFELHSILHDEQPYLFLYCRPNLAVYAPQLRNVRFYPVRPGFRIEEWRYLE